MVHRSVHATREERARRLPGDGFIDAAAGSLTAAVTVHAKPAEIWPWLLQMGAGSRGGWYSYDLLDNRGHHSATRIVDAWQTVSVGTLFPALPEETEGFHAIAIDPERALVLAWTPPGRATPLVTWAFVLEPAGAFATRLITRARGAHDYRFHGLVPRLGTPVVELVHFLMQRRQLLGIAERAETRDTLLDRFMPRFEFGDRHEIAVRAPADVTLSAAAEMDLDRSRVVRAIFRTRAYLVGDAPAPAAPSRGLLAQMRALGWGVLAEVPDREAVMGAVTRPWEPNLEFRAVPAGEFAAFDEAGYVKIAWTLRADPTAAEACTFRTETRAAATDADARMRLRSYWRRFSPGIHLIRRMMLRPLKRAAEARARSLTSA